MLICYFNHLCPSSAVKISKKRAVKTSIPSMLRRIPLCFCKKPQKPPEKHRGENPSNPRNPHCLLVSTWASPAACEHTVFSFSSVKKHPKQSECTGFSELYGFSLWFYVFGATWGRFISRRFSVFILRQKTSAPPAYQIRGFAHEGGRRSSVGKSVEI